MLQVYLRTSKDRVDGDLYVIVKPYLSLHLNTASRHHVRQVMADNGVTGRPALSSMLNKHGPQCPAGNESVCHCNFNSYCALHIKVEESEFGWDWWHRHFTAKSRVKQSGNDCW